jgi:threonine/homoserine/homoserine lactone efflux protein
MANSPVQSHDMKLADALFLIWIALLAVVIFNEFWWYTVVALFFGARPVRGAYVKAKSWIDRITGLFLGALGLRLLWSAIDDA